MQNSKNKRNQTQIACKSLILSDVPQDAHFLEERTQKNFHPCQWKILIVQVVAILDPKWQTLTKINNKKPTNVNFLVSGKRDQKMKDSLKSNFSSKNQKLPGKKKAKKTTQTILPKLKNAKVTKKNMFTLPLCLRGLYVRGGTNPWGHHIKGELYKPLQKTNNNGGPIFVGPHPPQSYLGSA